MPLLEERGAEGPATPPAGPEMEGGAAAAPAAGAGREGGMGEPEVRLGLEGGGASAGPLGRRQAFWAGLSAESYLEGQGLGVHLQDALRALAGRRESGATRPYSTRIFARQPWAPMCWGAASTSLRARL